MTIRFNHMEIAFPMGSLTHELSHRHSRILR
jgi:hypothetical protein